MTDRPDGAAHPPAALARRLVPVAVLVIGLILFFAFDLGRFLSLDALRENREALVGWVQQAGPAAWLAFVGLYALVVAFSVPGGLILTVSGGFLFGPVAGAVLSVIGATLGATALFLAARYAFADALRARAGPAIRRMEAGFNANAMSYLLFLRLVPLFPFWLVNLVPAFLGVGLAVYVVATAIGIIPATVVFALVGDGLGAVLESGGQLDAGIVFQPRFFGPILGLAFLALLPVLYKRLRRTG